MQARPLPPGHKILNALPIGICILRPDYSVKFWSAFLRDMTGVRPEQITNRQISDHFPNFSEPKYTLRISSIFSGGAPIVFSSQLHPHILPPHLPDIHERIWHTTVSPLPIPGGRGFYALLAFRDVTDLTEQISAWRDMRDKAEDEIDVRRGVEGELKLQAEQLEQVNQYKSEFLANTSHELRTPLNSMLMLSSELCRNDTDNLTDDQLTSLQIIHKGGRDLLDLINDLLDLSKIEAGQLTIHQAPVLLTSLMDDATATFAAGIAKKGLEFNTSCDEALPDTMVTDIRRLTQITRNLISNSLKFTDSGSISLSIHPAPSDITFPNSNMIPSDVIGISVRDTGMGIPEDKLQDVFQAFRQADGTISRQYGGTGLGLTISRKLAGLLGGELHVTSELNHGTTFTLYIPAEAMRVAQLESLSLPTPSVIKPTATPEELNEEIAQLIKDRHILLVDDDMRSLFALSRQFTSAGATVQKASDAEQAFIYLETHLPDLVVMDIKLPGLNGYEDIERIRQQPILKNMPIIILSAKVQPSDIETGIRHGAVAYLTKPLDQADLMKALLQAFE